MSGKPPNRSRKSTSKPSSGASSDKVGKGHPPVEHRFKAGQPSPNPHGRPKGSKNKTDLDRLMDQKVVVGYDSVGRRIRKKVSEVITRRLIKTAGDGNLTAMRLLFDVQAKSDQLNRGKPPDRAEVQRQLEEETERDRLTTTLTNRMAQLFDLLAQLKSYGIVITDGDDFRISDWARAGPGSP